MTLDRKTLLLVAWSVIMSVSAQVTLRIGMAGYSQLSGADLALAAIGSPLVWTGLGMYVLSTVSWLAVLSRIDLAVAYPLGSMSYVLVTLLSATLLNESVSPLRWVGTLSILIGILVVARGESGASETGSSR